MKRKILVAALLATMAGGAQAAFTVQDVYVYAGDGTTNLITGGTSVTTFDWAANTAVAVQKGPFGSDPLVSPNPLNFLYQAQLGSFQGPNGSSSNLASPGLGSTYEFTIAANITEQAYDLFDALPDGSTCFFTTCFYPTGGTVSIFYDTSPDSSSTAGTGYTDGTEIARMHITDGSSGFAITTPGNGLGSTNYNFMITAVTDFVNPLYIKGLVSAVWTMNFQSNQNYPPNTVPDGYFIGSTEALYPAHVSDKCTQADTAAGSCDLFLLVDSTTRFGIPEPGSLLLAGLGLSALGFARRRRADAANA